MGTMPGVVRGWYGVVRGGTRALHEGVGTVVVLSRTDRIFGQLLRDGPGTLHVAQRRHNTVTTPAHHRYNSGAIGNGSEQRVGRAAHRPN